MTLPASRRARLDTALNLLIIAEYTLISAWHILVALYVDRGADAHVYHRAVVAWLNGADPWSAAYNGVRFAAPPPTLLVMVPFAWVPEPMYVGLSIAASAAAAVVVLRRLRLPAWWLLFPPVVEATCVGSLELPLLALLLTVAAPISVFARTFLAVPLVVLRRWRPLAMAALILVATSPVLPWGAFLSSDAGATLLSQSGGGKSAWAIPWTIPAVLIALIYIGRDRAAWLAVPALWPASQHHYSVVGLPGTDRVFGCIAAIPIPGSPAIGVVASAIAVALARRGFKLRA